MFWLQLHLEGLFYGIGLKEHDFCLEEVDLITQSLKNLTNNIIHSARFISSFWTIIAKSVSTRFTAPVRIWWRIQLTVNNRAFDVQKTDHMNSIKH